MLRLVHVQRAMWPLLAGVVMAAAWSAAGVCGLCPQKSSASHCSGKDAHSALPMAHSSTHASGAALAIQDFGAPCSHCVTHSPPETNSSSQATLPNSSSHSLVACDVSVVAVEFSASKSLVEIHDHGPPGESHPRYLLNSAFRI